MIKISSSVGRAGANKKKDVLTIQKALNQIPKNKGGTSPKLKEDGLIGAKTIEAIIILQKANTGLAQDGRINVNRPTLACINSLLTGVMFDGDNLYIGGTDGKPLAADIEQTYLGDCFFVATLAALAKSKPSTIKNAITYDTPSQRFKVKLYNPKGQVKFIWVSQWELEGNIKHGGGSSVDDTGIYERTWPAVIETAYIKMLDRNAANGLKRGYKKINQGGYVSDALMAITGSTGTQLEYTFNRRLGKAKSIKLLGTRVATALTQGKSVTLSTTTERRSTKLERKKGAKKRQEDGLVTLHTYTVMSLTSAGTDWYITLRNPWGSNNDAGEGVDHESPMVTVLLSRLVETRGLGSFDISQ